MSGGGFPAAVSSTCPACGAGMEFDPDVDVLRCPYCRHEVVTAARRPKSVSHDAPQSVDVLVDITSNAPTMSPVARLVFPLVVLVALGYFVIWPLLAPDTEVAVGDVATVDDFEVTVVSVDCGKRSLPGRPDDTSTFTDESEPVVAAGTFCVMPLSMKNVGDTTDTFPYYDLEATNATGRVFEESSEGEELVNGGKRLRAEPIDPGKTVTETLVFDIPADQSIAFLRVGGDISDDRVVKVKLR